MELKERIRLAFEASKMTRSGFSVACGVSKASVTHWLNGATKQLKGPPAAHMEACSGYRAKWLIEGTGPMLVGGNEDANISRILPTATTRQSLEAFGAIIEAADALTRAQIKSLVLCMFDDVSTIPQAVQKIEQAICPVQKSAPDAPRLKSISSSGQ